MGERSREALGPSEQELGCHSHSALSPHTLYTSVLFGWSVSVPARDIPRAFGEWLVLLMRPLIRGTDILEAALPAGVLLPGSRADQQQLCGTQSRTRIPASPASFPSACSPVDIWGYWRHASAARRTENHAPVPMKRSVLALTQWPAASLCKVFGFPSERSQLASYCRQLFLPMLLCDPLPATPQERKRSAWAFEGRRTLISDSPLVC